MASGANTTAIFYIIRKCMYTLVCDKPENKINEEKQTLINWAKKKHEQKLQEVGFLFFFLS